MRSSAVLTMLAASVAVASPIGDYLNRLHKKAIVWDIVTEIEYVTVTAGHLPSTSSLPETTVVVKTTVFFNAAGTSPTPVAIPTTSSIATPPPPPPAPVPTTSAAPVVVVVETPTPAPAPSTTAAPAPVVEAPVVEAPAPVVEAPVVVVTPTPTPEVVSTQVTSPVIAAVAEAVASPTDFISSGLFWHNQHRKNHGASPLTWDADLAASAKVLADRCSFGHDITIGGGGYGQNIDTAGVSGSNAEATVKAWDPSVVLGNSASNNWYLAEAANFEGLYNIANPQETNDAQGNTKQFLHFTQMLWKDTTALGCAATYCAQKMPLGGAYAWYTVCNYKSAGNYANEYAKNVGKPQDLSVLVAAHP